LLLFEVEKYEQFAVAGEKALSSGPDNKKSFTEIK
jgi:hypothetical protein